MNLTGIILLVLLVLLALLAIRFLFGIIRIVVMVALAILALALLYLLLTGNDVFGIGPTVSAVIDTGEDTFDSVTGYVSGTINTINQTASSVNKIAEFVPKAQE